MKNLALSSSLKHLAFAGTFVLASCGSTAPILSTPIKNIDQTPVKFSELTERSEVIRDERLRKG